LLIFIFFRYFFRVISSC